VSFGGFIHISEVRGGRTLTRELLTSQRGGRGETLTGLLSTSLSAGVRVRHAGRNEFPRAVGVWKQAFLKLEW
jgi:hypothetical protein